MNDQAHNPMRILEIETFGRGGLIHYAYNLSLALAERGHDVTLVTAAGYELEGRPGLPESVRIVKLIARGSNRLDNSPRKGEHNTSSEAKSTAPALPGLVRRLFRKAEAIFDAFAVAALVRRLRPDVIHLHCTNPISLLYLWILQTLGRPVVATAHVVTPHELIRFQELIYRRIHRQGRLIIAHSNVDRRRLLQEFDVDPKRVTVIPHGEYSFFEHRESEGRGSDGDAIERGKRVSQREVARESLGLGSDDRVVLFFGYIREYKGLDVLLEAWPSVAEANSTARVVVAGDPAQLSAERRDELERWATRLGAICRFGYIPFSEVHRYFAAADVLVMPYRHISQSGVLFLALSLGVPIVATRVGAFPEMLRDGDSALLVPPDAPDELAQALIRVLGDTGLRERLALGGRRVASEHSWPSIAEQTETAFAGLTDQRDNN